MSGFVYPCACPVCVGGRIRPCPRVLARWMPVLTPWFCGASKVFLSRTLRPGTRSFSGGTMLPEPTVTKPWRNKKEAGETKRMQPKPSADPRSAMKGRTRRGVIAACDRIPSAATENARPAGGWRLLFYWFSVMVFLPHHHRPAMGGDAMFTATLSVRSLLFSLALAGLALLPATASPADPYTVNTQDDYLPFLP